MGFQRLRSGTQGAWLPRLVQPWASGYGGLPYIDSSDSVLAMSSGKTTTQLRKVAHVIVPKGAAFEVAIIDHHSAEILPEERQLIESWAPSRQREFVTGRMCARRALGLLGVGASGLLPDANGIPQWPEDTVGSISHCRGVAMAMAAKSVDCSLLGLDLEKTNRLSAGAIKQVLHPIEEIFAGGDQLKASILFSLKEAFYKAQFPKWLAVGNFSDLALEVDLAKGSAKIREMDARFSPELMGLRFCFRIVDDYVVSLTWM